MGATRFTRRTRLSAIIAAGTLAALTITPIIAPVVTAASSRSETLQADLEGRPINLVSVSRYFCHDFDYPQIHCFTTSEALSTAVLGAGGGPSILTSTSPYVVIYDGAVFSGASMWLSQNYTALATIGWNDRISSFVVKNDQSGNFYTDWFYGGSSFSFCCNDQYSSLGGYDNTFSSVFRN